MLSPAQQERFARHLLVEELGGEGQERLAAGAVVVELCGRASTTAIWATRYLAASGLGTLFLEGPWAAQAAAECARFWPEVRVQVGLRAAPAGAICVGEGGAGDRRVAVDGRDLPAAEAAALGARAALEVVKRIAGVGRPAALPLRREAVP